MLRMDQDIKYVRRVGEVRAKVFAKDADVRTVGDLLGYFPFRYEDRSRFYHISDICEGSPAVQLYGHILSFEEQGAGANRRLVAHFTDGTGVAELVWFKGFKYIASTYDCQKPYVVFGKPQRFRDRWSIAHPDMEKPQEAVARGVVLPSEQVAADDQLLTPSSASSPESAGGGCLRPVYSTTEGMKRVGLNSGAIGRLTADVLSTFTEPLPETLTPAVRGSLISRDEAVRQIHHPSSQEQLKAAQLRLKFEELFYVQLQILRYAATRRGEVQGMKFTTIGNAFNTFYHKYLPFQLTKAQQRVVREIWEDLRSGRQMNRLLQGDVGCGKTLVALLCALIAVDNGTQVCLMAPTEILAEQHLRTLRDLLGDMEVRVELLTGHVKGASRKELLEDLAAGKVHILVGTHAVIEEPVRFARLGLVVIDEQHRFGVAQRAKLWKKSERVPHVLVMTATPIPRTLAMTLYGDLDVSVIDELPPGRKPVVTVHQYDSQRLSLNNHLRKQIALGRQVYIVYPLIEESQVKDWKNLTDGYEQVKKDFPDCTVSMVHGRLKPAEKDEQMRLFAEGKTQIMVATTVIEVGVDVPNASVMVIENAERFGLSQLHQLRGRVGRGADQSFCILVSGYELGEESRKRIQVMVDTNDGFEIAEQDLRLRGPGDMEGTQQSGMAIQLKIANLARDGQLLQEARRMAQTVVEGDPHCDAPQNALLWDQLDRLRKSSTYWGAIS